MRSRVYDRSTEQLKAAPPVMLHDAFMPQCQNNETNTQAHLPSVLRKQYNRQPAPQAVKQPVNVRQRHIALPGEGSLATVGCDQRQRRPLGDCTPTH